VFVDFNAIDVTTKQAVAATIAATGAVFADGAIIGLPPQDGEAGPRFYVAGPGAAALARLGNFGLDVRVMEGSVGTAAALKMSYAGITKGLTAIATAMVLAATRAGSAEALHAELAASQPQLLARFGKALPDMMPKAYRWVAEMEEIAAFAGTDGARAIYSGAAEIYRRIAEDERGARTEIAALEAFLKL
jgi:L-threonate 2-dehydrogenase